MIESDFCKEKKAKNISRFFASLLRQKNY